MSKIFIVIALLVLTSNPAMACKCYQTPIDIYDRNTDIFLGKVVEFELVDSSIPRYMPQAIVEVQKIWKGKLKVGDKVRVNGDSGNVSDVLTSCGFAYKNSPKDDYLS